MSRVSNLAVFCADSGLSIKPGTNRYRIVQSIVDLGLSLLETPRGKQSLVEVATAIINVRNSEKPPAHHIYPEKDKLDRMPYWIERFLASMKANFPETRISEEVEGEAEAQRHEWQGTMSDYNPRLAGRLFLSKDLIDNMVYAHERPAYRNAYELFKFQMGVSIAHEIVHFLTGFLTGTVRPDTPPQITLKPWGNEDTGEAGRYWERILLGGVLEFWSTKDHPLKNRQSGMPYIFENGHRDARGCLVDFEYISNFNNLVFSFPIRTDGKAKPITRSELRQSSSVETTMLRQPRRMRHAPPAPSPPPGDPSWGTAFRRPPPGYYPAVAGGPSRRR